MSASSLRQQCIRAVAREIARPRVVKEGGWQAWPNETEKAIPEAEAKINAMSNLELLDIIWEVMECRVMT